MLEKAVLNVRPRYQTLSAVCAAASGFHAAPVCRAGSTPLQNDLEALQFLSILLQAKRALRGVLEFQPDWRKCPFCNWRKPAQQTIRRSISGSASALFGVKNSLRPIPMALRSMALNDIEVRADSSSDEAKALSLCKEEALKLFVQGTIEAQLGPSCLEKIEGEV